TIASVLKVREEPGRSLTQTLVDFCKTKSLLLVLDNCEHLLTACAQVVDTLLRSGPEVRILASSREPLNIHGEYVYRVPSFSLPDLRHLPSPESLLHYEAMHLFIERVRVH